MKNKKFITSKISISILIISIVFIGLAIIFAVWNNNKFKEKIILSAKSNLSVKAEIIATGIEKLLSEHARISQSLANDKFIINALLNKHAHEFYTEYCPIDNIYLTHIKEIDAIMLIAEDGTLLHRHPLISDSLPVFASREDIDYVIQNHRAHISGIYSNSDGKPTVAVSYPVFYQGRFIGVIRFTILVETFIEQFILPALDENTFAIGIDNQGKLFYKPYPEFKEKTIYDFLNEDRVKYPDHDFAKRQEVLIKSVRGESGSAIYQLTDKTGQFIKMIMAYQPINIINGIYSISLYTNYNIVLQPAKEYAFRLVIFISLIVLMYAIITIFLFRILKKHTKLQTEAIYFKNIADKTQKINKQKNEFEALYEEYKTLNDELIIAKEKVEESEVKYRTLVETQGEGLAIVDLNETFLFVNPAAEKFFETEKLVGMNIREFVTGDQLQLIKNQTQKRIKEEKSTYELEIVLHGDIKKSLLVTATPVLEGEKVVQTLGLFVDITERKNAELKIKESKKLYQFLFDKNPVSLFEGSFSEIKELLNDKKKEGITQFKKYFDNNPDFVYKCIKKIKISNLNKASMDLQKAPSKEEFKNAFYNIFNKKTIETFKRVLLAISEGKESFKEETELINFKNEIIHVIVQITIFENYSRGIISMTDITDRKNIKEALVLSEQNLVRAQHLAHIGSYEQQLITNKIFWSDELFNIYGIDRCKQPSIEFIKSVIHSDDKDLVCSVFNAIEERNFNGNNYFTEPLEYKIITHQGEVKNIRSISEVQYDKEGNPEKIIGTIQDLTNQKTIEKNMIKLSTAVEQSANMVIITDAEGTIEYVNNKFTEVTGYLKDELVSKKLNMLKSANQFDEFYQKLWATIKLKKEWKGEIKNKKKNGELYWECVNITPVLNNNSEIINFIGIIEDITERKSTEKKIFNAIVKTEEREKKRFAVDLHDGLGPILSAAKIYAEALKSENNPNVRQQILKKFEQLINEAIASTQEIANNISPHILKFFGLTAAINSFCSRIPDTLIDIDVESNTENRFNENIEISLYRILIELINNTLKHANASIIKINIKEIKQDLFIRYMDNGVGFDVKKVLDKSKGMGIKNIINRINFINGKINIKSDLNKGSLIEIILSVKRKAEFNPN